MKNFTAGILTVLIILLSVSAPALAYEVGDADINLELSAQFAPPHNEPVIGNRVARYRIQITPTLDWGIVHYRIEANAWGVNIWQRPNVVGHGVPEAWENSDWSVEEWRYTGTGTLLIDLGAGTSLFVESTYTEKFVGNGSYYNLFGLKWTSK